MAYGLAPALALVMLGAGTVSAFGPNFGGKDIDPDEVASRLEDMFEQQAEMFGLSVADVKDAWAEGKTMKDLAEEKGVDLAAVREKMQARRQADMTERLEKLVDSGVITQAQADSRLEWMEARAKEMDTKAKDGKLQLDGRGHMGGPMMGWF